MSHKKEPLLNDKRSEGVQSYATTMRGNILNIKTRRILMKC